MSLNTQGRKKPIGMLSFFNYVISKNSLREDRLPIVSKENFKLSSKIRITKADQRPVLLCIKTQAVLFFLLIWLLRMNTQRLYS